MSAMSSYMDARKKAGGDSKDAHSISSVLLAGRYRSAIKAVDHL